MKLKLSSRLILTMVVIQIIVLAILTWNNHRVFKQTHIERQELSYISEQKHLAETIYIGLVYADRAMLSEQLDFLKVRSDFHYAVITDRKNRLMASSGAVPDDFSQIKFNDSYENALQIGVYHLSSEVRKDDVFLGNIRIGFSTVQINQILQNAKDQNITITLIAIFLSLIASILLGRYISSNLRLLEKGAKHFADGELDYRIKRVNDNIIDDVASAFNILAENLQVTIEELSEGNRLLLDSEEKVRLLLDSTAEAIYGIDLHGRCTFANPACVRLLGYQNDNDLIGRNMHTLVHHTRLDGSPYPENECPINGVSITGKGIHVDTELLWRANGESFPSEYWSYPVIRNNEIVGAVVTFLNITERRLAEEGLRRSQKMDALGKLTGGIAHDYNNMLGVIMGYAELLNNALSDNPKLKKYVQYISNASERGAKLTNKLLQFTRQKNSEADILDINTLLQDEKALLEKTLTVRVKLVLDLAENLWPVWVDSGELEDAILNICINAMHAIDGNGKLTLQTRNEYIDMKNAMLLNIKSGDYVLFSITDTGSGMDEATKEKIFDPFFTTKGEEGTGLGLSQVYGFVEGNAGAIKVNSKPGHGTQLMIYFPRYFETNSKKTSTKENNVIDIKGTETILVVDDEPALLSLNCEILTEYGFNVIAAESAKKALEIIEYETIDLMISDILMPDMDGYQLAAIVKEKYPEIKIQLASGFSDNHNIDMVDEGLRKNILSKPFKSQDLLQRINKLLYEK